MMKMYNICRNWKSEWGFRKDAPNSRGESSAVDPDHFDGFLGRRGPLRNRLHGSF